jgi:hypothetical protein
MIIKRLRAEDEVRYGALEQRVQGLNWIPHTAVK